MSHKSPVCMIKAKSPGLENAFICLFSRGACLCFEGCVQLRVLAGLIQCNGYVMKPSLEYHCLYSPRTHSRLSLAAMDPHIKDEEFIEYLEPLQRTPVHFTPLKMSETVRQKDQRVFLDVDWEDAEQLNHLVTARGDMAIAAVGIMRRLRSGLVEGLNLCGGDVLNVHSSHVIPGFETVPDIANNLLLRIPPQYYHLAWDILAVAKPVVLVCGQVGSGKSTLCRFLVNYMLNRYPKVGYLECDIGQTEFTVPGVIALHLVTKPLLGPSYTHPLPPEKYAKSLAGREIVVLSDQAYYYGDKQLKDEPVYYVQLIQAAFKHFQTEVRSQYPDIPLVINTCGWLADLGVPIFLDIIRLLSPSHIIRFAPPAKVDTMRELGPLTPALLTHTPGLITQPTGRLAVPQLQTKAKPRTQPPFDPRSVPPHSVTTTESDDDDSTELSEHKTDTEKHNGTGPRTRQKLHARTVIEIGKKAEVDAALASRSELRYAQVMQSKDVGKWVPVLSHQIYHLIARPPSRKDSKRARHLMLTSYFSPLIPQALDILQQCGEVTIPMEDVLKSFMQYTPVMEIPWSDVAVHVVHRKVPNSQVLYAMNGNLVALGCVDPSELVDYSSSQTGMVKFLKSRTPLIEFKGLGLLRGIDPQKKVFYVTTPEPEERLEGVNVLGMGNSDNPEFIMTKASLPAFRCLQCGKSDGKLEGSLGTRLISDILR